MKWTNEKPSKPGYYWYTNCYVKDSGFVYGSAGIIFVEYSNHLFDTDERKLVALNFVSEIVLGLDSLFGMFSDEPIALPVSMM